jgi:acetate kinase
MASSKRANGPEPDASARALPGASGSLNIGRPAARVLIVNRGSSSIKFALYAPGQPPRRDLAGSIDRIGLPDGVLKVRAGEQMERFPVDVANHEQAVLRMIQWLDQAIGFSAIGAIGHRVVHGGPRYSDPQVVTPKLLDELRRLGALDPDHLPGEIALIDGFLHSAPDRPQVAGDRRHSTKLLRQIGE